MKTSRLSTLLIVTLTGGSLFPAITSAQEKKLTPAAIQFFETKVRPVLAENCFECHGDKKQKRGLRLDSLAGMLEGGDTGPAIVPGHPEKSLLVKAINHDGEVKMPSKTKKLPREQIDSLAQWIKMGAPWPGSDKATPTKKGEFQISDKDRAHWAYQPVKRPTVPEVKNKAWVRNAIDAFILAKLEAKGLQPAPPASKQEIARRLYYDITGLPPTPKEIEAFVNDNSADAYEKLVDKLLASPHYGEKWARHWLDLVRYAETNSYERDNPKPHIWRYRDYVIRAFNEDKPYDRFLREQLAGDELFDFPLAPGGRGVGGERERTDALIATGFYRLGVWDDEPVDAKQARYDGLDDLVATIGQSMLGMTLDCARCHNHKIDPIAQKDYYKMVAFLHGINHYRGGGPDDVRPVGNATQMEAYKKLLEAHEEKLTKIQATLTAIENDFRKLYTPGAQAIGNDLDELTYKFYRNAWTKLPDFTQFKPEDEGKLPKKLFDISPRTRNEAFGFVYDGLLIVPQDGKYTFYLDSDDGSRLSVNGKTIITYDGIHGMGKGKKAAVELKMGRVPVKLEYFQNVAGFGLYVGWSGPGFDQRNLSVPTDNPEFVDINAQIHREGARVLGEKRYQQWFSLVKQRDLTRKAPATPNVDMALCVVEAGAKAPETFVFNRGNPHVPTDKVEPGFPMVFNLPDPKIADAKPGAKSSGRRTVLANWIASKDNPMTARVMVNRLWQHHFGRGIVRTPNDYGLQGMRPTHPELLDWLASEFVDPSASRERKRPEPWSMKAMHKLILTSNAYRMASRTETKATELGIKLDQSNDLFWHFDMRRLTAEEIRDSILAVSGNLNLKAGGPGIYPPIPKEVLAGQSVPGRGWPASSPEEAARRSVYVHVKRSLLLPILDAFDLAEPDRTTPVRFSSTVPTQALSFLNGEFMNTQAKIFAARLKKEAGDNVNAQVRLGLYLATTRQPNDADIRRGTGLIETLLREDGLNADAALQAFCLVVLNLNEFMYLD
jgi:mono/diheme cytochrome c family protein